jgi:RNA polymerase sigma-70 factor (ECF subfamily)
MKGYCTLFVPDKADAEDIIQDCFLKVWEKRASIDVEKSIESYLFVILRNHCLNYLKDKRVKGEMVREETLNINELQYLYQLDLAEREEKSLEEQLIIAFQNCVETLPRKTGLVFRLCKIEGMKQKEVADELDISLKAVEKHIAAAKQKMIKQLSKQYPLWSMMVSIWLQN